MSWESREDVKGFRGSSGSVKIDTVCGIGVGEGLAMTPLRGTVV